MVVSCAVTRLKRRKLVPRSSKNIFLVFMPLTLYHYRVLQNGTPSQIESESNNPGSSLEKTNQQADYEQTPRAETVF